MADGPDEIAEQPALVGVIERFGVYPRITGELIFARADTGTAEAKSWQPIVAAVADLHVRWRDPTWLGSVWNTIDPALGLHIASLDQGDESIGVREIAASIGTIPYELLCRVGSRIQRVYS